jgi:hypothetical protein
VDDGHAALSWNDGLEGFATQPLPNGARVALSLPGPTLALMNAHATKPSQLFLLRGRRDREARAWLGEQMRALGLDPAALDALAPWQMPPHAIADGGDYRGATLDRGLADLAAWFANANGSLGRIRQHYVARGIAVSPVRCWPHHFDITMLILVGGGKAEPARSVSVGFSPGDESCSEPYYYVSPRPAPDAGKLPPVPPLGHWRTQGYLAAVASANRILATRDAQMETEAFLYVAVEAAIAALS